MSALDDLVTALMAGGVQRVYKLGSVPASPRYSYAVMSFAPDAPRVRTMDGSGDLEGRFTVQHFGESADAVSALATITFETFDGKALPLPGEPVAALEIATAPYRDPDDRGVLDVLHTYRY